MKNYFLLIFTLFLFGQAQAFVFDGNVKENSLKLDSLKKPTANSIKVFWWNIEKGLTNKEIGTNSLEKNLIELALSNLSPDVMFLGEASNDFPKAETLAELREIYPFSQFDDYNRLTPGFGILTLSKHPLKVYQPRKLSWIPAKYDENEQFEFMKKWSEKDQGWKSFTRRYLRFQVTVNGKDIDLIPFHGLMPWKGVMSDWGFLDSTIGKLSVGLTMLDLDIPEDNPLVIQLRNLKKYMQADFGEDLDAGNLILLGDFNFPMSVYGVDTSAKLMFHKLNNVTSEEKIVTFPARSAKISKDFGGIRIDHAFISKKSQLNQSFVLELQGSDHYPLYLEVEPK